MSASLAQVIGALAACGGAAVALLARDARERYAALGIALLAAVALVLGEVWEQPRFAELRTDVPLVALGVALGAVALAAATAVFVRNPAAVAIAAFAVLALRLPLQVGDETNFLLVPLYGVIAAGWARGVWLIARGRAGEVQTLSSPREGEASSSRWLCAALGTALVVYAVGLAWTEDPRNAIVTISFFLTPFAALLVLLRDLRWHRKLLGQALAASVAAALVFAAIALWQYLARDLLLNTELKDANQLHLYFRVNSLFRDPNVLGRYLVFAIVALAAWCAWRRDPRQTLAAALLAALLLAALVFTYSQTSFAALVAGLAVLVCLRLGRWGLAVVLAVAAVGVAGLGFAAPASDDSIQRERDDLAEASSGRSGLVAGGFRLFKDEPLVGQGSGAFSIAYRQKEERIEKPVSHMEPITVAAEQGVLGLVPYAAILILSGLVMLRPWPDGSAARAGVAALWVALLIHTLGYAGFLIDPATWALLALGLALRE